MRIFTSVVLSFLFTSSLKAQDPTLIGNNYVTTVDQVIVYAVKSDGRTIDSSKFYYLSKGTKFSVLDISKDKDLIIEPWKFKKSGDSSIPQRDDLSQTQLLYYRNTSPQELLSKFFDTTQASIKNLMASYKNTSNAPAFISGWANNKRFVLATNDLSSKCALYHARVNSFIWGAVTLPIKLRLGNGKDRLFDNEENLNLGLSFGLKTQLKSTHNESFNYLLFAAIGNVKVDSASLSSDQNGNAVKPPTSNIANAFSLGGGFVFAYETNFQAGLFIGMDYVTGSIGRQWKYQGKPWIGIGLGVALFSANGTKSSGTDQDQ